MKNKSTLLKIRKHKSFLYLSNHWRKKSMQIFFFFLIREIADKSFRQIIENFGIGR